MRRTGGIRFRPRGRLGARERDDLQGLRECDVREDLPLVLGAPARARVLGVPVAALRVRRAPACRTAGDNHPIGGAAYRRDLVGRSVPDSHHVNVSRHPRKVAPSRAAIIGMSNARHATARPHPLIPAAAGRDLSPFREADRGTTQFDFLAGESRWGRPGPQYFGRGAVSAGGGRPDASDAIERVPLLSVAINQARRKRGFGIFDRLGIFARPPFSAVTKRISLYSELVR